jgi:hypothetical protein
MSAIIGASLSQARVKRLAKAATREAARDHAFGFQRSPELSPTRRKTHFGPWLATRVNT